MADPGTSGHHVELAGPDQRSHACAVVVLDLTAKQPADCLKAGMGVGWHIHASGSDDIERAVMVSGTPRSDERSLALR
jgi:hypothetical protein